MTGPTAPAVGGHRMAVLLSAVDNALRNGSWMSSANLAFEEICERLGVDRDALPPFDPHWAQRPYPRTED